jgi:transcriptional regulator with XRE-family HTH domain
MFMQKSLSLFLKELRHDTGKEKLSDMAAKLGVSASYLSTIENGKRNMNDKLYQNLIKLYQLSKDQAKELNVLRNLNAKSISINTEELDEEKKDTVIKFLSSIDDLSKDEMKKIQYLINRKDKH